METPISPHPLSIIVVDDDPVDVSFIRWVLTAHALAEALHVIDNGDAAWNYVQQLAHAQLPASPTMLLLDLHVSQRDGRDILQCVKALPHGADIRVVVVTRSTDLTEHREALALGADAYFIKPYHLNEFMHLGTLIKDLACRDLRSCLQNT